MKLSRRSMLALGLSVSAAAVAGPRVAWAGQPTRAPEAAPRRPIPFDMPGFIEPTFPERTFSIAAFGAQPGGTAKNTRAIADAIAACARAGGGRVLVPAGVWLTGPIHLRSNVNLHLAEGAVLRFSQVFADYLPVVYTQRGGVRCYNYSPLIYAHKCTNIAVTGAGTLDGQGEVWWPWKKRQPGMSRLFEAGAQGLPLKQRVFGTEADGVRPPFIQPIECRNVLLEGFTVTNGPSWNIHPVLCENVTVRRVSVTTMGPNNDGIDPDACRNVVVEDCLLDTGDDCICLKAGRNEDAWAVGQPCENVVVRRCRTLRGHGGVVLGSEMSAGIRNVLVHDCQFEGTQRGIRIKSCPGRGGAIENVWFQDIAMDRISAAAIHITLRYTRQDGDPKALPRFRNIHVRNVTCGKAKTAVEMFGLPEQFIENVSLEDVTIASAAGLRAEQVRGVRLTRVRISAKTPPVMQFTDSQDVLIQDPACPGEANPFLQLSGPHTKNIQLRGIDPKCRVVQSDDVPAGTLKSQPGR